MGDLSITTPAHLNWVLNSITEIRYTGWDDDEPCPLPVQPAATLDTDRVSSFVCSRIVAQCPAVESRRGQLLRVLTSPEGKALISGTFWMLFLEFFALTDGVARVGALRHIVGNLLDELHQGATDEAEQNECLSDPRAISLIENALRSGVQQGSALTQGFLSSCGYVTMDVTGVLTTTAGASSSQQTTAVNVTKVPLPHHLSPKILEDIDSFSIKKRQSGGSKKGIHTSPNSRSSSVASCSSSVGGAPSDVSTAAAATIAELNESEENARKRFLRSRSRSVQEDSPEVLLQMAQFKQQSGQAKQHDYVQMVVGSKQQQQQSQSQPSSRPSSVHSNVSSRGSAHSDDDDGGSVASSIEASALSATRLTSRKSSRKKIRLNSRASSLFLGECNQPEMSPGAVLKLVSALGTQFSAASIKATEGGRAPPPPPAHVVAVAAASSSFNSTPPAPPAPPEQQKQQRDSVVSQRDSVVSLASAPTSPYGSPSSTTSTTDQMPAFEAVLAASTSNNVQQQQQQKQEHSTFGMTRAVLEEIVRAKMQDYQFKPYSGRTEATAALRTLRDAHLLTKPQCRKLLMDKAIASVDAESITKKRGIVLAALETVAEEQNRLFSRVSVNFAAIMKMLSPRGHASSFSVPRDMVLPFLSDALAQMFCAVVFDVCPYLRSELKVDTRRAVKRHLSFWLDGVDSDNVSNWTQNWARPRLLIRQGAEKATVGGVKVGQSESQQQQQLEHLRSSTSSGQQALVVSPLARNLSHSHSASSFQDNGSSSSTRKRPSPLGKKRISSSARGRRNNNKDPLSPTSASLNPENMAMMKHMELNQQLSLITGGLNVVPPPRNARVELIKTFNKVEERRREDLEAQRDLQHKLEQRDAVQQQQMLMSGGSVTPPLSRMSSLPSSSPLGIPAPQHQGAVVSFDSTRRDSGLETPKAASLAPHPPPSSLSREASNGGGDDDVFTIQLPVAMVAKSLAEQQKPHPPPSSAKKVARPSSQRVSTRLYNPHAPGSTLTTPLEHMTNEERLEMEERRKERHHRAASPSASDSSRRRSPDRSKSSTQQQQQQQSVSQRKKSPPGRRKSIHQVEQERHQRRIVEIRERLEHIQELLTHQQMLEQQYEEKGKHRRKFMSAAAIAKEEEDLHKKKRAKQESENRKLLKQQQQQQQDDPDAIVPATAASGGGKAAVSWKEQQQNANKGAAGFGLYWRGKANESAQHRQQHEHEQRQQQRAASARQKRGKLHYRQPTEKVRDQMMHIHEYQDEMEAAHPGEYKYQPRRKMLSEEELTLVMQEQQALMQLLSEESAGVADAYEKQMAEEMLSTARKELDAFGKGGDDDDDDDDGSAAAQMRKRFGAQGESRGMQVGARDVVKALEAEDERAASRRKDVRGEGIGTRSYTASRGHILTAKEKLANANKLIRTHRFAPCNQPDQPWHRFGAQHRPPPSATAALTQGREFYAEAEFAMGDLSPVMERFCIEQGVPSARDINLKYPSKMLWHFIVKGDGKKK